MQQRALCILDTKHAHAVHSHNTHAVRHFITRHSTIHARAISMLHTRKQRKKIVIIYATEQTCAQRVGVDAGVQCGANVHKCSIASLGRSSYQFLCRPIRALARWVIYKMNFVARERELCKGSLPNCSLPCLHALSCRLQLLTCRAGVAIMAHLLQLALLQAWADARLSDHSSPGDGKAWVCFVVTFF
jgi:hypothetical protein